MFAYRTLKYSETWISNLLNDQETAFNIWIFMTEKSNRDKTTARLCQNTLEETLGVHHLNHAKEAPEWGVPRNNGFQYELSRGYHDGWICWGPWQNGNSHDLGLLWMTIDYGIIWDYGYDSKLYGYTMMIHSSLKPLNQMSSIIIHNHHIDGLSLKTINIH